MTAAVFPALPTLASTLLNSDRVRDHMHRTHNHLIDADPNASIEPATDERVRKRRRTDGTISTTRSSVGPARCPTGFKSLDSEVLDGGLSYGRGGVVGVAAERAGMGVEIAYQTLTSHFLSTSTSDPDSTNHAFYIDASRTFDPRRLLRLLLAALHTKRSKDANAFTHTGGFVYSRAVPQLLDSTHDEVDGQRESETDRESKAGEKDLEKEAMIMMDRVHVIRVFDFEGLMEAIEEVKRRLEDGWRGVDKDSGNIGSGIGTGVIEAEEAEGIEQEASEVKMNEGVSEHRFDEKIFQTSKKRKIADSDASESEEDDLDAEMLLEPLLPSDMASNNAGQSSTIEGAATKPTIISTRQESSDATTRAPPQVEIDDNADVTSPEEALTSALPSRTLLLVSSLPRVLSPAMQTNHVRAHALVVGLLRQVHLLTLTHPLCAVFLNSTVEIGTRVAASEDDGRSMHAPVATTVREEGPSAFGRNAHIKPAGGKTLDWFWDLSLLVTGIGAEEGGNERSGLVEVLHDREEGRVGRWAVVEFGNGG